MTVIRIESLNKFLFMLEAMKLNSFSSNHKVYRERDIWNVKITRNNPIIIAENFDELKSIVTHPHNWEWLGSLYYLNDMLLKNKICNDGLYIDELIYDLNSERGYL